MEYFSISFQLLCFVVRHCRAVFNRQCRKLPLPSLQPVQIVRNSHPVRKKRRTFFDHLPVFHREYQRPLPLFQLPQRNDILPLPPDFLCRRKSIRIFFAHGLPRLVLLFHLRAQLIESLFFELPFPLPRGLLDICPHERELRCLFRLLRVLRVDLP